MCKNDTDTRKLPPRLLLSLDSFQSKEGNAVVPDKVSFLMTGAIVLAFLIGSETFFRYIFKQYESAHPLLEDEMNRFILARHVGVDAMSCGIVAFLGLKCYPICKSVLDNTLRRNNSMPPAAYDARLFTLHPAAYRIAIFFFFYQVKNLYDTIIFDDGPEYIFHHIFSLITAWGSMYPCSGNYYAIFFFGISEISTAVLCLLANFDDEHGVVGLGDAMPMTKIALGVAFVVLFILCRCILWPIFSYYFVRDINMALKNKCERTKARGYWFHFFMISLTGLSILQVAWLGQIFILAQSELAKVGLL